MTMSTLQRMIAAAAAVVTAAIVSGCGGGGAGAQGSGNGGGGGGGATGATALTMTTSVPAIGSDGKTVATITAFVKDSGNRALANQLVEFSTADNGAVITGGASQGGLLRTDDTGSVSATLAITDPTNRVIDVVARSGSLTSTLGLVVAGTALTLDGPANLVSNAPTEFTVALRNSAGDVIPGKQVLVSSSAGNALSTSALTTDAAGRAKFTVTGTKSGADTIRVDGLGASASLAVSVASTQLAFSAPSSGQELVVGATHNVSVTYSIGGVPQVGRTVSFFATRGAITATVTTDANGQASATISALTAGVSTITASADSVLNSRSVEFVSRVPAKISVQPSPANVTVNLTPSGTNSSQLIAVVRDANDNPVKGQIVTFSADQDPSGGRIEPAVATTDSSGVASVAFYPGGNTTGNLGIIVRATVPPVAGVNPAISGTTALTASGQELDVTIGTGNVLENLDAVAYGMPWDAVVTDASGRPVENATVQASLVGVAFYKGQYYPGDTHWYPGGDTSSKPPFKCISEDANGNLRLDPGEDTNGDNELTPSNVAAVEVLSANARTDESGFARIRVKYPKQFANWVRVRLTVTITVIAGTESTATREFVLPVVRDHVKLDQNPPGGVDSVFGVIGDCTTTN